jgi:RNA polymerase sigma-70 factor (ECF subfamily)
MNAIEARKVKTAEMLTFMQPLLAYAISLCKQKDRAEDLLQQTLLQALEALDSFKLGSCMSAWLFTIMRNTFLTQVRKWQREISDSDGRYAETLKSLPTQESVLDMQDLQSALLKLPVEQRETLSMIGIWDIPYEEVAEICSCAVGTSKSRASRARDNLKKILGLEERELDLDASMKAVVY